MSNKKSSKPTRQFTGRGRVRSARTCSIHNIRPRRNAQRSIRHSKAHHPVRPHHPKAGQTFHVTRPTPCQTTRRTLPVESNDHATQQITASKPKHNVFPNILLRQGLIIRMQVLTYLFHHGYMYDILTRPFEIHLF